MKGSAVIELTDVNTGKVTTIRHDNMVTNAVQKYCRPIGQNGASILQSCAQYGFLEMTMSGLLLLDSALDENVDTYYLPGGVQCVGRGSDIAYTGADTNLGSFNAQESGVDEDGNHVLVWDFATNQANGTIASLALTSYLCGRYGFGSPVYDSNVITNMKISLGTNGCGIPYLGVRFGFLHGNNWYTDSNYNLYYSSSYQDEFVKNTSALILRKWEYPVNSLLLKSCDPYIRDHPDEIISIPLPPAIMSGITNTNSIYGFASMEDNFIYCLLIQKRSIAPDETINILKIDVSNNYSTELISFANNTGENIELNNFNNGCCMVGNGYFACRNTPYNKILLIKLSDPTDIKALETTVYARFNGLISDTLFLLGSGSNFAVLDSVNLTIKTLPFYQINYNGFASINKEFIVSGSSGNHGSIFRNPFYLATINNLTEPVNKTASQTMKVTYTLSKA